MLDVDFRLIDTAMQSIGRMSPGPGHAAPVTLCEALSLIDHGQSRFPARWNAKPMAHVDQINNRGEPAA
jgi:hypothetical protein